MVNSIKGLRAIANQRLSGAKPKKAPSAFNEKVSTVMREYYGGKLKDAEGKSIKDKNQALAIAYTEAEKLGLKR